VPHPPLTRHCGAHINGRGWVATFPELKEMLFISPKHDP
jgi:hypothetical protein